MLTLRAAPAVLGLQVAGVLALGLLVGWGTIAWLTPLLGIAILDTLMVRLAHRTGARALGPADLVTLIRATLTCGVVALVVESLLASPLRDPRDTTAVVTLASVSLALDGVDGWLARRTGSASAFGARFDGEADAYLILVLSVWVATSAGWWVLAIGLARYVFAALGLLLPWLRAPLPPRDWRKVVAATAGIVLVVAAADVVPSPVIECALVAALLLVGGSFGRDVWWLQRHRSTHDAGDPARASP